MTFDFSFLTSNRFWVMIAAAVIGVLKTEGILDPSIADVLVTLCLGFISVRTVDRFAEKAAIATTNIQE